MSLEKIYNLTNVLAIHANNIKKSLNTMIPCVVVKFYPSTQTVDIIPGIKAVIKDDDGEAIIDMDGKKSFVKHVDLPIIQDVPIQHLRAGNYMITIPIQEGDTGMAIFSQRDISKWKKEGGISEQTSLRVLDINDAVYSPFVPNRENKINDYNPNALEIRAGSDKISMDGSGISITGNLTVSGSVTSSGDMVAGGTSLQTHKHSGGTMPDGNTGTPV